MSQTELTAERVRELLSYDPDTGVFRWILPQATWIEVGDIAGSIHKHTGYRYIGIAGKKYKAHRLAWLYVHGVWPAKQLDHRYGIRDDNRIAELREATNAENAQNRPAPSRNTSGHIGVSWHKIDKKWRAYIHVNRTQIPLGNFDSIEIAVEARAKAKAELHTFQPFDRTISQ